MYVRGRYVPGCLQYLFYCLYSIYNGINDFYSSNYGHHVFRFIRIFWEKNKSEYEFLFAQVSHLFDNEGTVAFAMFMAIWGEYLTQADLIHCDIKWSICCTAVLWFAESLFLTFCVFSATLFLELWKRHRARHVSQWKVFDWCEEEVSYEKCNDTERGDSNANEEVTRLKYKVYKTNSLIQMSKVVKK